MGTLGKANKFAQISDFNLYFYRTGVSKLRQVLLNCLNMIIGSQLGKCLHQLCVSEDTLEHILHVCLTSHHVTEHLARYGGLSGVLRLMKQRLGAGEDCSKVLRLLGCLCCNNNSVILDLVTCYHDSVLSVIQDIVCQHDKGEQERREGVGVLAQITASRQSDMVWAILRPEINTILHAMKHLLQCSKSPETMLLCSATTLNITTMTTFSSDAVHNLLSSLLSHPACHSSVYIQEQMVGLINNLMRTANTSTDGKSSFEAVNYMLELLNLATLEYDTTSELYQVAKRTVTKAVIGLAKMCLDVNTSRHIMRLGGLNKMTAIVQEDMFREDETVKLAVVAALRSVCTDYTESFV